MIAEGTDAETGIVEGTGKGALVLSGSEDISGAAELPSSTCADDSVSSIFTEEIVSSALSTLTTSGTLSAFTAAAS